MAKIFISVFLLSVGLTIGTCPSILAEDAQVTSNEGDVMMEPKDNQNETSPAEQSFIIETTLGTEEPLGKGEENKEEGEAPLKESESDRLKEDYVIKTASP